MTILDPAVRAQLRFVQVSDPALDVAAFPDFMLIGPQRTGTTWLHANLRRHPEISMTREKELYYFSSLEYPETYPSWMPPRSAELSWYLDFFRLDAEATARREADCQQSYGEPFEGRVRGEATASYAAGLSPEVVDDIVALNPALKAIVLVRDPIDRAWSHAKKDLAKERKRKVEDVPEAEWLEFTTQYYQLQCARYSQIFALWRPRLRDGHLLVEPFEEIARDPGALLLRVFDFLGVRSDPKYVHARATEQINATQSAPMPAVVEANLRERLADELRWLAEKGWSWPTQPRSRR